MSERIAAHHQLHDIWVLVAGSQSAHIYSYLKNVRKIPLGGANKHHFYTEKPGHILAEIAHGAVTSETMNVAPAGSLNIHPTASSDAKPAHSSFAPSDNVGDELKRRYLHSIAAKLHTAYENKRFGRLVLAAPVQFASEIKSHLSPVLQTRILAMVPKDLSHLRNGELMSYLRATLAQSDKLAISP